RDAAVEHELAGEDEERNGEKGEHSHPRRHPLEDDRNRQSFIQDRADRRQSDREGDRDAEDEEEDKRQREYRQCHAGSTSVPCSSATMCSMENRTISAPAIATGT